MKLLMSVLLLSILLLACGCTTQSMAAANPATLGPAITAATPANAANTAIPDLTGTWAGPMAGYAPVKGFTNYGNATMTMVVTEQKGRIFACAFVFGTGPNQSRTDCSGVIGRDGRTFILTQTTGGYSFGDIISPSELQMTYVYDGKPNSAALDTLYRV